MEFGLNEVICEDHVYATGSGRSLHLDLFRPQGHAAWGQRSAWVLFHGGGWRNGSKERYHRQAKQLVQQLGVVAACPEYRLSGEAPYPAQLEDAKSAVGWMQAHAVELGVDPNLVGAMGGSAGGHLAALVGLMGAKTKDESSSHQARVAAVVCFNGVFDLVHLAGVGSCTEQCSALLGGGYSEHPQRYAVASPIKYVTRDAPPFLLLHGTADQLVPFAQAEAFAALLRSVGSEVTLIPFDGARHGFYQKAPWYDLAMQHVLEFVEKSQKIRPRNGGCEK